MSLVEDHRGQFGNDAAVIARTAVGIGLPIDALAFDRSEIAQAAAVRGLRRKECVVDRAFDEVAHAGVTFQPKQTIINTELIRGGAGFAEVAAPVLIVGPNLTLACAAGDEQAVMVQHEVERTVRLHEEAAIRLSAVEFELRQ